MTVLESLILAQRIETLITKHYERALTNMIKDGFKREHDLNKRIRQACLNDKSHTERLSQ